MEYKIIFFSIFLLLIPLVQAETTFFDQDDAFVMGNSPTTDSEIIGGVTGGGGCRYEWNCTDWSECLPSGKQTRNCTNIGTCSDRYKTPELGQNCTYTAPEEPELSPEDKEEGKENVTEGEEGKETGEQEGMGKIIKEEIIDKNKIIVYSVIILIILSIILYLKKDYFKKLVKKIK